MDIVAFNKLRYLVSGDSLGNIAVVNLLNEVIVCQFNLNDQINMIKSVKEEHPKLAIIATVSGGLYLLSESDSKIFESSGKKIMKNLEQFGTSVTHWKVLDKDIEELDDEFAPFDERVSTEFLGKLSCMENNQKVETFTSTYKQSYRHKQLLQDIHHQCHSL
ncbi:uncharacterized protein SPAPADRAFT_62234 [Spathaspora passalidarum NRRL Y-27907]|uniref:Cleavage/polyadenylation specificity factor A subunit C-terminal domain-containing protein n=1 Tax=Spathaspora passalidarum (strain NRRL Y-27907 / 11-Y1) TaxID=619300 RepID=G3AQS7_SPAPN|nr:uncharacterized protein SPAPADRAFT_62234 [Spathaspora passalidarum NRRL Y-27907]EGW31624.1 hypothetical protein SPAPADRAFT_62234 [Spathaspora passalidarum NRRL Y-27907]